MKYQFLGHKKILWLIITLLLLLPGIAALIAWKLPLGIDFQGGAQAELQFEQSVTQEDLRQKLVEYPEARGVSVTTTDNNTYLIRVLPITEGEHREILKKLEGDFGTVSEIQFQSVGPSVSADLTRKAAIAVVVASLFIVLYLAYSFRRISKPVSSWSFGLIALVALLHDLIISVGVFAILAHYFHYEVDSSLITALLTIMGFSVHDTIVVFDRIRENLLQSRTDTPEEFEHVADRSLAQTLNRSLATSLTVIATLAALALLGGESIRPFVITLLVGITVGTYSSIFTATPLLVLWQNRILRRAHSA